MVTIPSFTKESWSPVGFGAYERLFPETGHLPISPSADVTQRFIQCWEQLVDATTTASVCARFPNTTVVFVRGFLGNWMPKNLVAPMRALRRAGMHALILPNSSGRTCAENVAAMVPQLARHCRGPFILCGHSRGGLESLLMLDRHPALESRCQGVLLSQTPRAASPVLKILLRGTSNQAAKTLRRRAADRTLRSGLLMMGAGHGGREMAGTDVAEIAAHLSHLQWRFPVLQTASWSTRPTAWLDSFHERLGELSPGQAHDGQFFLRDLIWPGLRHVLLPQVDHAQPVVGGAGFDHVRYWWALLSLLGDLRARNAVPASPKAGASGRGVHGATEQLA